MTKRNRLDDFHALQGVLGTKTLKIDVNHGSARRGLVLEVIQFSLLESWGVLIGLFMNGGYV